MHMYMYVYMCMCMYVHVYAYVYMYICMDERFCLFEDGHPPLENVQSCNESARG